MRPIHVAEKSPKSFRPHIPLVAQGQNGSAAVDNWFAEQMMGHSGLILVIMFLMLIMSIMWIIFKMLDDGNLIAWKHRQLEPR